MYFNAQRHQRQGTSPSELFLECVLKMSTLFSHTGCQMISPLVDSIVNDLLLEFQTVSRRCRSSSVF